MNGCCEHSGRLAPIILYVGLDVPCLLQPPDPFILSASACMAVSLIAPFLQGHRDGRDYDRSAECRQDFPSAGFGGKNQCGMIGANADDWLVRVGSSP